MCLDTSKDTAWLLKQIIKITKNFEVVYQSKIKGYSQIHIEHTNNSSCLSHISEMPLVHH